MSHAAKLCYATLVLLLSACGGIDATSLRSEPDAGDFDIGPCCEVIDQNPETGTTNNFDVECYSAGPWLLGSGEKCGPGAFMPLGAACSWMDTSGIIAGHLSGHIVTCGTGVP